MSPRLTGKKTGERGNLNFALTEKEDWVGREAAGLEAGKECSNECDDARTTLSLHSIRTLEAALSSEDGWDQSEKERENCSASRRVLWALPSRESHDPL